MRFIYEIADGLQHLLHIFFSLFVCVPQSLTAPIPAYQPTPSGRAKLSTGTSHSEPWCPMTAIPVITSSAHQFSPASRWVTGTSHYQNAWVCVCRFSPITLFLIILTFIIDNLRLRGDRKCHRLANVQSSATFGSKSSCDGVCGKAFKVFQRPELSFCSGRQ